MAVAALAAAMMNSGKRGFPFGNLFSPFDSSDRLQEREKAKETSVRNLPAKGITISAAPSSGQGCDKKPSEASPRTSDSTVKTKPARPATKKVAKKRSEPVIDEKFVMAVVEKIKTELPSLVEQLNNTPTQTLVSETYDAVYRSQIAAAQEFLNENRAADLSRVKCLLHKLLPKEYFEYIEQLREHQDPQTIINIMGGHNIVAPNAREAGQSFHAGNDSEKEC